MRLAVLILLPTVALRAGVEPESFPDADLSTPYRIEVVAKNLRIPWSIAFLPGGKTLVSERQGRVRVISDGVLLPDPAFEREVPRRSTNGFLGLAVHLKYEDNGWVYLAYNQPAVDGPTMLRVSRFQLRNNRFVDEQIILDNLPAWHNHTGCRLLFGPDGKLYLTVGDANQPALTQRLDLYNGKVLRVNDDGSAPEDNPFVSNSAALPEIFSYGHRNGQGLAFHPSTGALWEVEHGAGLRDELNRIVAGGNYGWSVIEGLETNGSMQAPALSMHAEPALAPGGMAFYSGDAFPELRGAALVAIMQGQGVMWVATEGDEVAEARMLFRRRFGRIRDVTQAPDGSLYLATSMYDNRGLRIVSPPADYDMVLRIVPADWPASGLPVLPETYSLDAPIDPAALAATKPDPTVEDRITRHCASCHGDGLAGGLQSSLIDGDWALAPDPNTQYFVIANGLADRSMPPYKDELTPAQIHEILRFIVVSEQDPR